MCDGDITYRHGEALHASCTRAACDVRAARASTRGVVGLRKGAGGALAKGGMAHAWGASELPGRPLEPPPVCLHACVPSSVSPPLPPAPPSSSPAVQEDGGELGAVGAAPRGRRRGPERRRHGCHSGGRRCGWRPRVAGKQAQQAVAATWAGGGGASITRGRQRRHSSSSSSSRQQQLGGSGVAPGVVQAGSWAPLTVPRRRLLRGAAARGFCDALCSAVCQRCAALREPSRCRGRQQPSGQEREV